MRQNFSQKPLCNAPNHLVRQPIMLQQIHRALLVSAGKKDAMTVALHLVGEATENMHVSRMTYVDEDIHSR